MVDNFPQLPTSEQLDAPAPSPPCIRSSSSDPPAKYSRLSDVNSEKSDDVPPTPSHCSTALTTFLCIVLTAGAHYSEESLAPEEPALEALGFGPVTYALLTIAPTALGLVSPFVWGAMWDRHARSVLIMAPLGELTGASLIVLGLWRSSYSPFNGPDLLNASILAAGLLWLSACRAGLTIAEFSTIGRVFAGGSTEIGFASLVVAKHLQAIATTWGVPLILKTSPDNNLVAILRVQLCSLLPHILAVIAGAALAARLPTPAAGGIGSLPASPMPMRRASASRRRGSNLSSAEDGLSSLRAPLLINSHTPSAAAAPGTTMPLVEELAVLESTPTVSEIMTQPPPTLPRNNSGSQLRGSSNRDIRFGRPPSSSPPMKPPPSNAPASPSKLGVWPSSHMGSGWQVVFLLGLWRALQVGTLHAYHSVRIQLLVSSGDDVEDAGDLFASYDALAIVILPLLCGLTRLTGLRPLLACAPLLSLTAAAMLAGSTIYNPGSISLPFWHTTSNSKRSDSGSVAAGAQLLTLSIMEISAPIIPLAMLPANAGELLGAAYGAVEAMFIVFQMCIKLLLGFVRSASGFSGALALMSGGFVAALLVSLPLIAQAAEGRDASAAAGESTTGTPASRSPATMLLLSARQQQQHRPNSRPPARLSLGALPDAVRKYVALGRLLRR